MTDSTKSDQLKNLRKVRASNDLQHVSRPADVFAESGLVLHRNDEKKIPNTTAFIDLRQRRENDPQFEQLVKRVFVDRNIKREILWQVQDARLKSTMLHCDSGRVSYYSRAAGILDQRISENARLYKWTAGDEKTATRLPGTTAMIGAPGAVGNYYHWSMEVMPRLYAMLPHLRSGAIDRIAFWVFPEKSFQLDYLNLVVDENLRSKIIGLAGKPTIFENLVFFENRAESTRVTDLTVDFCRHVAALVPKQPVKKKVYILRKPGNFRRLLQEEELVVRLEQNDFSMVEGGELTLQEQIGTFKEATVIAGVHGAGLTNLAFAPAGATFIELTSKTYYRRVTYSDLAMALGFKVKVLLLDEIGEFKSNIDCPDLTCETANDFERLCSELID